jgi:hypothetical protein
VRFFAASPSKAVEAQSAEEQADDANNNSVYPLNDDDPLECKGPGYLPWLHELRRLAQAIGGLIDPAPAHCPFFVPPRD